MTAAHIIEQFENCPNADAVDPVADPPPPVETENDRLLAVEWAHNAALRAENAALVARVAQLEAQREERWMTLQRGASAARPPQHPEHVRRLALAGEIKARQEIKPGKTRGRWHVEVNSIDEYQTRLFAK